MADAFRGLTLRLGADARPLQSAISAITRSAGEAQREMNRLNKALKFDGNNAAMMQSRIDLLGDKAQHSARAITKIKTAMQQAVAAADGFDLAKLAAQTTKAHSETEKLRAEYNHVDASLQHVYDSVAKVVMRMSGMNETDAVEYVKLLKEQMNGTGAAADKAKEEFAALLKEASKSTGINEKFGQARKDYDALAETVKRLIERHKELNAEYKKMNAVQGFRAMQSEVQVYMAEVRQAAAEMSRFQTELHMLGTGSRLAENLNEIRLIGEATDKATANAQEMIAAYKAFPKSFHAASAKMRAVAAAQETIETKANAIKAALKKIESDPAFNKLAVNSERAYVKAMKVEQAYSDIAAELILVEANASDLKTKLNSMDETGVDKTSSEYKELSGQLKKAETEAEALRAKLRSMDDSHATAALTVQYRELETQLAATRTQAAALNTQVSKLRAFSSIGKSFREFGFGMYASLTPAIMMAGRYAIQAAEDTDKAYRDMRKTVNGTEEDFEHLLDAALEFSTTHVTTAETMLEIEAMGGQLGIQVENLEAFAHTVSNLDIATNMQSDEIAADLGKMATVMGMTEKDYDHFADSLVRLGNNMPAFESDIMKITTRFMGMGKIVGMAPDQMLAWSTAATATGQKAEAAGSSMLRFISNMESAVYGSEETLQEWASVAGMSGEEFKALFQEDASGAMYKFIEGLGNMQRAGDSVNQELKELKINNVRDKQLLEGLANQMAYATEESNVLADSLRMSNDAWNGEKTFIKGKWELAGDAMREAEKKSEGFSGSMQKMRNQATLLANVMAQGAAPIVNDLGKLFGDLASAAKALPDDLKTMIVGFAGLLAAIGPLTVGLGTFFQSFERIAMAKNSVQGFFVNTAAKINSMNVATERGMKANLAFQKAFRFLGSNGGMLAIAGVATAIGLISNAIKDSIKKTEDYKKATEGLHETVGKSIPSLDAQGAKVEGVGNKLNINAKSADELADSQAQMADRIKESNVTAQDQIARLNAAKKILDDYMGKSGLTAREQGQFKAAVDTVNEVCGTQYSVLDAVNGALADENGNLMNNCAAIDDYINQKKEQIRVDALSSGLSEMYTQESDLLAKLTDEYATYQQGMKKYLSGELSDEEAANFEIHGKDEYEKTKQMYEDLQKEIASYEAQLGSAMTAQEDNSKSLNHMVDSNMAIASAFVGNAEQLDKFKTELEAFGMTSDVFDSITDIQWSEIIGTWSASGRELGDILKELGFESKTMAQVFGTEMKAAGDKFAPVAKALGMTKDEAASALQSVGVSAQQLADTGSKAFINLYETSGKNLELTAYKLEALNRANIDPKQLVVNDGQLQSAKGNVIDFDHLKIGDKYFKVTANGIEEIIEKTEEIEETDGESVEVDVNAEYEEVGDAEDAVGELYEEAEKGATVNLDIDDQKVRDTLGELLASGDTVINAVLNFTSSGVEEVTGNWNSLKESVEGGANGEVSVAYKTVTSAIDEVDELSEAVENIPDNEVNITVVGGALSEIRSIDSAIRNLPRYTELEVHTKRTSSGSSGGNASGGIIPRNAAGAINGIVNRAMLTNIGWVGEAGAEAVMHMKNAGGAVIPLSNRRYVRPFARAVASEISQVGSSQVVNKYYSVGNISFPEGSDGARALEALYDAIRLEEAV